MMKKLVYSGLLLILISIIIFFAANFALSGNMASNFPSKNITLPSDSSSYMLLNTSDAPTSIVSAALSSAVNLYVFNTSNFDLWQHHMASNASANGLKYAQSLYPANSSFIFANTALLLPANASGVLPKNKLYNNSIYFVIDNTNGSSSSNKTVNAKVVYLVLDSAILTRYRSLANNQMYAGIIALALFIAGIVTIIYGLVKADVQGPSVQVPTSKKAASKDYIDSLYKNVSKQKRKGSNSK